MLEIFALPYFVGSGAIGWAIFSPFFQANDSDSLSCANVTISDLLAISFPASAVFLSANWLMPESILALWVQVSVVVTAFAFAAAALTAGLLLVPKKFPVPFVKRITIVAIISPFGILLTICWIGFLAWACVYSMLYLIPSMIAIAAVTFGLRFLGLWVCRPEPQRQ